MVMTVGVTIEELVVEVVALGHPLQQASVCCCPEQNSQRDVLFRKPIEKGTISKYKTKEITTVFYV